MTYWDVWKKKHSIYVSQGLAGLVKRSWQICWELFLVKDGILR